jgi:parallel beta-helix repeat protein
MLLSLLLSSLAAPFLVSRAEAVEIDLTIDASGTPSTDAPLSVTGSVYTLTEDVLGSVTIDASNIVFNGGGFTVSDSDGFYLAGHNVTVTNVVLDSTYYGVMVTMGASDCNITGNTFRNVEDTSIYVNEAQNPYISKNTLTDCYTAIYLTGSDPMNGTVDSNRVTGCSYGVMIYASNNTITRNIITCGDYGFGLDVESASDNVFYENSVIASTTSRALYVYDTSNNLFYYNNFIAPSRNRMCYAEAVYDTWDNGVEGNYWSADSHVDLNSDGIVDSAFILDDDNVDNFPLASPYSLYMLNLAVTGSGSTNLAAGANYALSGEELEVTATPVTDGEFLNWILDGVNSTGSTITVTMDQNHNLTAAFKPILYTLTVEAAANGEICRSDGNSDDLAGTSISELVGTQLSYSALANEGCLFRYWLLDGEQVTTNPISVTFDGDHTLEAVFSPNPYCILPNDNSGWPTPMHDSAHTGKTNYTGSLTNQTLWRHQLLSTSSVSPVSVDGTVFVSDSGGYVYAINASTNQAKWIYEVGGSYATSPTVVDGVVYVGSDTTVFALNASSDVADGELLWHYTISSGWGRLSAVTVSDSVVYAAYGGTVYTLDAVDGSLLWTYQNGLDASISACTVANDKVYINGGPNIWITATNGTFLWSYSTGSTMGDYIAVSDGILYAGNNGGDVLAFNALTNSSSSEMWSYTISYGTMPRLAVADGVVYAGASSDVCALNGTTGATLWVCNTNDYVYSAPIISNGIVYVGLENKFLAAFNATTTNPNGEILWTYISESYIRMGYQGSPAIANGVLYAVGSDDSVGYVYAFTPNTQIAFTATGLEEATSWAVTFNGITRTSTLDTIIFAVCPQGEYTYSIETPDGYHTNSTLTGTINVNGTDAPISVSFVSDAPAEYTLTTEVYLDGVLIGSQQNTCPAGDDVNMYVEDLPPGWAFDYICIDGVNSTDTEFTLIMDQDHTVKAYFLTVTSIYQLTVLTRQGGSVDAVNGTLYQFNDVANLTATANPGYAFTCWMIDGETNSTDNPLAITMDGNYTVTAVFTEIPTTIIASDSNQTYTVRLEGNITAKQMSNMTITPHSENSTTNVAFTVTGPSGEVGYGTIIMPKEAIPYGSTPLVYIDGVLAENQTYTQDDQYFYISYSTHFSTHDISIVFTTPSSEGTSTIHYAGDMTPTNHTRPSANPTPTVTPTPTPTITPTPTASPTVTPTQAGIAEYMAVIAAIIVFVFVLIGLFYRRKNKRW